MVGKCGTVGPPKATPGPSTALRRASTLPTASSTSSGTLGTPPPPRTQDRTQLRSAGLPVSWGAARNAEDLGCLWKLGRALERWRVRLGCASPSRPIKEADCRGSGSPYTSVCRRRRVLQLEWQCQGCMWRLACARQGMCAGTPAPEAVPGRQGQSALRWQWKDGAVGELFRDRIGRK